jgi:hypothetical protein
MDVDAVGSVQCDSHTTLCTKQMWQYTACVY